MYGSSSTFASPVLAKVALLLSFLCFSVASQALSHSELNMNGIASYWSLSSEIYAAALYMEEPHDTEDGILYAPGLKRMEMRVVADKWRERSFAKIWTQAIIINNDKEIQQALVKEIAEFTRMPKGPFLYGDKITIDYTPGDGTRVKVNDTELLHIENELFFNALLRTWIGARPPSTEFKDYILKLDESDLVVSDLLGFYDHIEPDLQVKRYKETAAWKYIP